MKWLWCWLMHQPKYGWCEWTAKQDCFAKCECLRCGLKYKIRIK